MSVINCFHFENVLYEVIADGVEMSFVLRKGPFVASDEFQKGDTYGRQSPLSAEALHVRPLGILLIIYQIFRLRIESCLS